MYGRRSGLVVAAPLLAVLIAAAGCSGRIQPDVTPSPVPSPSAGLTIPAGGVPLSTLGFTNGPVQAFSVPRNAIFVTAADQPNVVTMVLSTPAPDEVAAYLRQALPQTGFRITADDRATQTMTFTGYGWSGSFTAGGSRSAVRLAPG